MLRQRKRILEIQIHEPHVAYAVYIDCE